MNQSSYKFGIISGDEINNGIAFMLKNITELTQGILNLNWTSTSHKRVTNSDLLYVFPKDIFHNILLKIQKVSTYKL